MKFWPVIKLMAKADSYRAHWSEIIWSRVCGSLSSTFIQSYGSSKPHKQANIISAETESNA